MAALSFYGHNTKITFPEKRGRCLVEIDYRKAVVAEVKAALSVYIDASRRLDKLLNNREKNYARIQCKTPRYGAYSGKGNSAPDWIAEGLAAIDVMDQEIREIVSTLPELFFQARALIDNDRLSPAMQLLLVHKYINGYTFKRISEKTDYNVDHLRRLHGRALAILAGID